MPVSLERMKEIFGAALEVADPAARSAYLDEACAGDADLRHEVESLLAAIERQGGAATLPLRWTTLKAPIAAGTVIAGKYKLIELIGEGGMGSVYLARQTEPVQRDVALKLIKAGTDTRAVLARFEAERQALALMDHPNIARVFDGGTFSPVADAPGSPYFVMEYVRGVPITAYCDDHRFTPAKRLELFVQVCKAVQHAHQKGIIHRDLKPMNVLVIEVDGKPTPKVIDFGVAKATEQSLTNESFGDTGAIVGTPQYMSPEQAESSPDIDTRTDVYALGVMLYELLTGTPPLEAKDFRQGAVLEMLRMVREVDPPKPSTKASTAEALPNIAANRSQEPSQLLKMLRGDVDRIVMKSLEKDRNRRYESANSFAADVQRFLDHEPVEARPPSRGYRLRKFVRRNRAAVTATLAVMAALIAGIIVSLLALREARHQESLAYLAQAEETRQKNDALAARAEEARQKLLAQASEKTALEERDMAFAIRRFLRVDLLQQADASHRAEEYRTSGGREYQANPRIKDLLDRAYAGLTPELIEKKFPNQKHLQGAVLSTLGDTYLNIGEYKRASEILDRVATLGVEVQGPEAEQTLQARYNFGLACLYDGDFARAAPAFESVLAVRLKKLGPDHHDVLSAQNAVGSVWCDMKRFGEGIPLLERTRDALIRTVGPDNGTTLATMNNLALGYQSQKKYAEAVALLKTIIEAETRIKGPEHPGTLTTMSNLATALHLTGKSTDAVAILESVSATRLKVLGPDHRSTASSLNRLGRIHREMKNYTKSTDAYAKAYEAYVRIRGAEDSATLIVANNLAWCYDQTGRNLDAIALYEKVKEAQARTLGPGHQNTLVTMTNLAFALQTAGQHDRSTALLKDAAEGTEKLQFNFGNAYIIVNSYIERLAGLEKFAEAEVWRRKLVTHLKTEHGGESPEYIGELYKLSALLVAQKKFVEVEPLYRKFLAVYEKKAPDEWSRFNVMSELGQSLMKQKKYQDAGPLLLKGYEGLKARRDTIPDAKRFLLAAIDRLIELADETKKPDDMKKWQAERKKYE